MSAPTDQFDNKINDSTGEITHFLCGFWCFLLAIFSCLTFLHSYQSLSLQDTLIDPLGPEVSSNFLSFSKKLLSFRHSHTEPHSGLREYFEFTLFFQDQCEVLTLCSKLACENDPFSHCVTLIACKPSFQNFGFKIFACSAAQISIGA